MNELKTGVAKYIYNYFVNTLKIPSSNLLLSSGDDIDIIGFKEKGESSGVEIAYKIYIFIMPSTHQYMVQVDRPLNPQDKLELLTLINQMNQHNLNNGTTFFLNEDSYELSSTKYFNLTEGAAMDRILTDISQAIQAAEGIMSVAK